MAPVCSHLNIGQVCPAQEPGHQEEGERTCSLRSSRGAENGSVDAWAEKQDPGWASRQR